MEEFVDDNQFARNLVGLANSSLAISQEHCHCEGMRNLHSTTGDGTCPCVGKHGKGECRPQKLDKLQTCLRALRFDKRCAEALLQLSRMVPTGGTIKIEEKQWTRVELLQQAYDCDPTLSTIFKDLSFAMEGRDQVQLGAHVYDLDSVRQESRRLIEEKQRALGQQSKQSKQSPRSARSRRSVAEWSVIGTDVSLWLCRLPSTVVCRNICPSQIFQLRSNASFALRKGKSPADREQALKGLFIDARAMYSSGRKTGWTSAGYIYAALALMDMDAPDVNAEKEESLLDESAFPYLSDAEDNMNAFVQSLVDPLDDTDADADDESYSFDHVYFLAAARLVRRKQSHKEARALLQNFQGWPSSVGARPKKGSDDPSNLYHVLAWELTVLDFADPPGASPGAGEKRNLSPSRESRGNRDQKELGPVAEGGGSGAGVTAPYVPLEFHSVEDEWRYERTLLTGGEKGVARGKGEVEVESSNEMSFVAMDKLMSLVGLKVIDNKFH